MVVFLEAILIALPFHFLLPPPLPRMLTPMFIYVYKRFLLLLINYPNIWFFRLIYK